MPYQRRLPRIPASGRVATRLTTEQRDILAAAPETSQSLAHELRRCPVHGGKLEFRVTREALTSLITAAANHRALDRAADARIASLLRYLESIEDRFEDPAEEAEDGNAAD